MCVTFGEKFQLKLSNSSTHNTMSSSTFLTLLFAVHLVTIVTGIHQEITLYTRPDHLGDSVTFDSSKSDVSAYSHITNNVKSYCVMGRWNAFQQKDFKIHAISLGDFHEQPICENYELPIFSSIRHLGASDTTIQGLSLYEGTYAAGREHYVAGQISKNLPFSPMTYVSSGKTVWTLFEGENYDGNSMCTPQPTYNMHYGSNLSPLLSVGSVIKGCGLEAQRNIAKYKLLKS